MYDLRQRIFKKMTKAYVLIASFVFLCKSCNWSKLMSNQCSKNEIVVDKEQPLLSAPSFNEENMNLLQFPKLEEKKQQHSSYVCDER